MDDKDELDPLQLLYGFIAGVVFMLIVYYATGIIS